ncbi:ABC transporter substrate-binding protein SapA [Vibrio gangliei]|uniref:ABC transporter substrate-binding protein SapA n=1 Tax=Vibrio gangliei TaxID=2077090 RepID=UPI000D01E7DF|nr:ABC transporter substrate-binding protein SapA [Vibrio gangliei]
MFKTRCQIFTLLLTLVTLVGCKESPQTREVRQTGFVYCGTTHPIFLNPQLSDSGDNIKSIGPQLFDSLLVLDPQTFEPLPHLATRWQVSADKTVYTFTLREDVQFQHTAWFTPTRALNAHDVVFSFNRILDSENPYHYVNGGRYPWFESIGFQHLIHSVKAIDDTHVQFTLNHPDNTFLANISTVFAAIHSQEYAHQLAAKDEKDNIDSNPVGTGPFQLSSSDHSELVRLSRHDGYWNGTPKMAQVVFDFSHRGTGNLAKLLTHECDVMADPMTSQLSLINNNAQIKSNISKAMNVAFLSLNTQHYALTDIRVRHALSYAINRQNIIDAVYFGQGYIASSLLPEDSWAYQDNQLQIRYDPQYAKALLQQAGYSDGLSLTMWVPLAAQSYNPSPNKTAELIQSDLAKIGIKLSIFKEHFVRRHVLLQQPNTDLILTGWAANTGEPDSLLRPQLSCEAQRASLNVAMWCDPDFDFLLTLARESEQTRHRLNLYHQAQTMLTQQLPIIPIAHGVQYQVHDSSLSGFVLNPFNSGSFENVVREK